MADVLGDIKQLTESEGYSGYFKVHCEACRFYDPHYAPRGAGGQPPDIGVCRRHSPKVGYLDGWPHVRVNDWCGEGEGGA